MRRDLVIQAAYFAVIAMGDEPTRRSVAEMARRITNGKGIRAAEIADWLKLHRSGTKPEPAGNQTGTAIGTDSGTMFSSSTRFPGTTLGTATGTTAGNHSRARDKVLESENSGVVGSVANAPSPTAAAASERRVEVRLPLDRQLQDDTATVLKAVWGEAQPFVRGETRDSWGKKNRATVRDMLQAGETVDTILAVWRTLSNRWGQPVYTMTKVQREMQAEHAPGPAKRGSPHREAAFVDDLLRDRNEA